MSSSKIAALHNGERLYTRHTAHWTAAGHRLAADALHDFLLEILLTEPTPR